MYSTYIAVLQTILLSVVMVLRFAILGVLLYRVPPARRCAALLPSNRTIPHQATAVINFNSTRDPSSMLSTKPFATCRTHGKTKVDLEVDWSTDSGEMWKGAEFGFSTKV